MSYITRIISASKQFGEYVAIDDGTERISYNQLRLRSNIIAHILLSSNGRRNACFAAILLPRSHWFTVSTIGILKAGMAYIPLDTLSPSEYNISILGETSPIAVITTSEIWQGINSPDNLLPEPIFVDRLETYEASDEDVDFSEASLSAALFYTSGTTGSRKAVLHSLNSISFLCENNWLSVNGTMPERPVFAVVTDLGFIACIIDLYVPLMLGGISYIVPDDIRHDTAMLSAAMSQKGVCHVCALGSVAAMLAARWTGGPILVAATGERYPSASASLPDSVTVVNSYGMSECGICCRHRILPGETQSYIGCPVDGVNTYILDSNMNPVARGETGELYVSSDGLALRYFNNEELTSGSFLECPFEPGRRMFRTRDLVRELPDGVLQYSGRTDDMVKVRGHRIMVGDVENAAMHCAGVESAAVVQSERGVLTMFYTGTVEESDVKLYMLHALPSYMCPAIIIRSAELPMVSRGKTDRKALRERAGWTKVELLLAAAFEKVLGIVVDELDADFMDCGGDSLSAMSLAYEMNGYGLDVATIFRERTLKRIADTLGSSEYAAVSGGASRIGLNPLQRWIASSQMGNPDLPMWNISMLLRLGADCNISRLCESLHTAVCSHPSLTARLRSDGHGGYCLEHGEIPPAESMVSFVRGGKEGLIQAFDLLSGDPLFRMSVVEAPDASYLFMDFHHLVCDGTSVCVFLRNVFKAYRGEALPEDRYWQCMSSSPYEGSLRCSPMDASLLQHYSRMSCTEHTYDTIELAQRHWKATINVMAVAAAMITLYKLRHESRVCVNWLYCNRGNSGLKDAVGVLVRTFSVEVDFEDYDSNGRGSSEFLMDELLQEIKRQMEESVQHPETDWFGRSDVDFRHPPVLINNQISFDDPLKNAPFGLEMADSKYAQMEPAEYMDIELIISEGKLAYNLNCAVSGSEQGLVETFRLTFEHNLSKLIRAAI